MNWTLNHFVLMLRSIIFIFLSSITFTLSQLPNGPVTINNSILSIQLNGLAKPGPHHYPCITSVSVNKYGVIMPPFSVGALFQMSIRSKDGNKYNPTLSGDCHGDPSKISSYQLNWSYFNESRVANNTNGVKLIVQPRPFQNESGACASTELSPYHMTWAVQLGDNDNTIPSSAMIIYNSFQKLNTNAPDIKAYTSALPTVYYNCSFSLYAYYMPFNVNNSTIWKPFNHPNTGNNYVPDWPNKDSISINGYANIRCDSNNTEIALCSATYYNYMVRNGGKFSENGVCIANVLSANDTQMITDMNEYGRTVIYIVGNRSVIIDSIKTIAARITDWGNV